MARLYTRDGTFAVIVQAISLTADLGRMKSPRSVVRLVTFLSVVEIVITAAATMWTQNPEWLVAGGGFAVLVATVGVLILTGPLVQSSENLVKSYDNLRYLENKRDSIDETRKRHAGWTTISTWEQSGGNVQQFIEQGSSLVGDPWLQDYREICEFLQGMNPGLDRAKINNLVNNKARQRKVDYEQILEHLQRRPASTFSELEDLSDPEAYKRRHGMFPYDGASKAP